MARAIVTIDLGFGDSGKGTMVEVLCQHIEARLVCRYSGGCQAGHNVLLGDGRHHCFSQWGAGTFQGIPTWLWKDVIIDPLAMINEAAHLTEVFGNPWPLLKVHPLCPVATPIHRAINRKKEIERGKERHGSCGMGVGECRNMTRTVPQFSVLAKDLTNKSKSRTLLNCQQEFYGIELEEDYLRECVERYHHVGSLITLDDCPKCDSVVFEGAQGVLIDENVGFHPYTTWSTVTLEAAKEPLECLGITDVYNLGITRTLGTRHGPGPFPGEIKHCVLESDHNSENDWQGRFRVGYLDLGLLEYAAKNCGGQLHGIALTWLDKMPQCVVDTYLDFTVPTTKEEHLARTEKLMKQNRESIRVTPGSLMSLVGQSCRTGVSCVSYGPTIDHKLIHI